MRAILCLILVLFAFVFESPAVTLEAALGSSKVSGELVGVTPGSGSISFKIKPASGVQIEVEMYRLDASSRDRAIAWMGQAARANAAKVPNLRFAPSKQVTNIKDAMSSIKSSMLSSSIKLSSTQHVLAVQNAGAAATGRLVAYQLFKQIKTGQSRSKGSWKEESWGVDGQSVASLQPKEVQKMALRPLEESQSKKVMTAGASSGGLSTVEKEQVKFEAVYLMAFDDVGNLIYFVKV